MKFGRVVQMCLLGSRGGCRNPGLSMWKSNFSTHRQDHWSRPDCRCRKNFYRGDWGIGLFRGSLWVITSANEVMCFGCLSVRPSVCQQHSSKAGGRIWLKFCTLAPFRPRTNWLTFEPDPDHSPDPGSGFRTFCGISQRFQLKSDFDQTWHAGNARLSERRPSVLCLCKQTCFVTLHCRSLLVKCVTAYCVSSIPALG